MNIDFKVIPVFFHIVNGLMSLYRSLRRNPQLSDDPVSISTKTPGEERTPTPFNMEVEITIAQPRSPARRRPSPERERPKAA